MNKSSMREYKNIPVKFQFLKPASQWHLKRKPGSVIYRMPQEDTASTYFNRNSLSSGKFLRDCELEICPGR